MTVEQAAVILGLSRPSAYKAAGTGDIPTIRVGRRLLVPTARLRSLLGLDETQDDGMARLAAAVRAAGGSE